MNLAPLAPDAKSAKNASRAALFFAEADHYFDDAKARERASMKLQLKRAVRRSAVAAIAESLESALSFTDFYDAEFLGFDDLPC